MKYKIRQYQPADLDDVLNTWDRATRLAHAFMTDAFIAQERKNIAEIYLPKTNTWVSETTSGVNGFISLIGSEVAALFVQPNDHGKGIGGALMDKAKKLHGSLEVEVFKSNKIGRHFYAAHGFTFSEEKLHPPTNQQVLRLILNDGKGSIS
ncbi:GNAT family N-acetyltransferase [Agaribacter marinus]|uniref:Acetyltransferase n=1 Tax=Agaribacter marinus TaxID=1431249 RepID=A0AA37SW65_9ALTE|nr:GNAT family N-acetyltransferase [Agaribacter marinus]GLR70192.1 acetyltransferase [Agaribacter marinus]